MELDERQAWVQELLQLLNELPEAQANALRILYFGQGRWDGADGSDVARGAQFWAAAAAGLQRLGRMLQADNQFGASPYLRSTAYAPRSTG